MKTGAEEAQKKMGKKKDHGNPPERSKL